MRWGSGGKSPPADAPLASRGLIAMETGSLPLAAAGPWGVHIVDAIAAQMRSSFLFPVAEMPQSPPLSWDGGSHLKSPGLGKTISFDPLGARGPWNNAGVSTMAALGPRFSPSLGSPGHILKMGLQAGRR